MPPSADDERRPCVLDANVLLDLAHGQCLGLLTIPVFRFMVAVTARREARDVPDDALATFVAVVDLDGAEVAASAKIRAERRALSVADADSLVLCQRSQALLLTGDRAMRTAAEALGIMPHGVLWLLDQAIEQGDLAPADAAGSLERMVAAGARLPDGEVQARLRFWA